jgi:Hydantoinase B/oxoprolinase
MNTSDLRHSHISLRYFIRDPQTGDRRFVEHFVGLATNAGKWWFVDAGRWHEASYPFMIESFSLRTDSGGAGEFRGGLGLTRRYLMLAPGRISTRFERTLCPAWGMNGGHDAEPSHVLIEFADGTTQEALKEAVMLKAGDRVRIHTGGGGYGDPRRRSRERCGPTSGAATSRRPPRSRSIDWTRRNDANDCGGTRHLRCEPGAWPGGDLAGARRSRGGAVHPRRLHRPGRPPVRPETVRRLGAAIVVDNRGGAGGGIGAEAVAKAEPDG